MSATNETEFGEYVFNNDLTTFEALSRLDVTHLGGRVEDIGRELAQTRSELNDISITVDSIIARANTDRFRIDELESDTEALRATVTSLQESVTTTIELANEAARIANTAQAAANSAQQAASAARVIAGDAQQIAITARTTANEAQDSAAAAQQTASVAQQAASAAVTAASTAQNTAIEANQRAGAALSTANQAGILAIDADTKATRAETFIDVWRDSIQRIFCLQGMTIYGVGPSAGLNRYFQISLPDEEPGVQWRTIWYDNPRVIVDGNVSTIDTGVRISPPDILPGQEDWPVTSIRTGRWYIRFRRGSVETIGFYFDIYDFK